MLIVVSLLLFGSGASAQPGGLESVLTAGRQLVAENRLDEAIALLEIALERTPLVSPDKARESAALATEIARLQHRAGRLGEAERLYERCVTTLHDVAGPADPAAAACRYNLGGLAFEAGRHADAEEHFGAAFFAWKESLGPGHGYTLEAGEELAVLYRLEGRLAEAAALYEELITIHAEHHGADDPSLPALLQALAAVELERGRHAEAEIHLGRALGILRRAGDRPLDEAGVLAHLAILETRLGLLAEAEKHYREALGLYDRHAPDHPDAAATRNNLALLYVQADRDEDAEPLLRRSLDDTARRRDPGALVPTLANLAALYDRLGRGAESLAMTRRAAAILGPQLELVARRDPEDLGPHESLLYELALLHRKNLELSGKLQARTDAPELGHPHAEGPPELLGTSAEPYWAQIGSRSNASEARRDLEALARAFPQVLSGLPHRLQDVDLGERGVWHRMQFGPFESRADAERLCGQLAERGYGECLAVREPRQ